MERPDEIPRLLSFFLTEEFSLQSFSSGLAVLHLANEILGEQAYKWRIVTALGTPAISSCGVHVSADVSIEQEREFLVGACRPSLAVICGGNGMTRGTRELVTLLRECRLYRVPIAATGGAISIPANAGLLRGRRCAVHWEHFPSFFEQYRDIEPTQTLFEVDGDFLSCAGGMAAFDLFLQIVNSDYGRIMVDKVCEKSLSDRPRDVGERQRLPLQTRLGFAHPGLVKVIEQMEANLAEPLRLSDLVPASGLSRRQVERLFDQEFGRSPAKYYLEIRLEKADLLIKHSSLLVIEIAIACGFTSASHFSKAYKERYGATPQRRRMSMLAKRTRSVFHIEGSAKERSDRISASA